MAVAPFTYQTNITTASYPVRGDRSGRTQKGYNVSVYAVDRDTGIKTRVGFENNVGTSQSDAKIAADRMKAQYEAALLGGQQGFSVNTGSAPGEGDQRTTVYSVTASSPDDALKAQIRAYENQLREIDDLYTLDYIKANNAKTVKVETGGGQSDTYTRDPSDGEYKKLAWDDFGNSYFTDDILTEDKISQINKSFLERSNRDTGAGIRAELPNTAVKTKDRGGQMGSTSSYVDVVDPTYANTLKTKLEDLKSQLTGQDTEYNWTGGRDITTTVGRSTAATGRGSQAGSTGAPTPGPGETFGGTGVLQTTQPTPGVTQQGTVTGYTPPAPTPVDPTTGVSTIPTQTGGLSALPPNVTYATRPAGTPGYVQGSLLAPSMSGTQQPTTYEQWMSRSSQPAQGTAEATVPVLGGYTVKMPDGSTQRIPYGQPIPAGATIVSYYTNSDNVGEDTPLTMAEGGSVDRMLEAKFRIARMNGYSGPKTNQSLDSFARSNESIKRKFNAIGVMLNKGGFLKPRTGYQGGGVVISPTGDITVNGQTIPYNSDTFKALFSGNFEQDKAVLSQLAGGESNIQGLDYLTQAYSATPSTPTTGGVSVAADGTITINGQSISPGSDLYNKIFTGDPTHDNQLLATVAGGQENIQGFENLPTTQQQPTPNTQFAQQALGLVGSTMQPIQSSVAMIQPQAEDFIPLDAGQTAPVSPFAEAAKVESVAQAAMPGVLTPAQVIASAASPQVQQETARTQAAQGVITPQALVQAAQQEGTSVANLQAAQGQAIMMNNPVQREIQQGELISGVADAQKAAQFNEQIQAATATPTKQATVAGQLETLMAQFEGGETPAWAAGSMRQAMATLAARGLGASSLAGQAVIQAAMEAALPIAQLDAQTQAQFEAQNLSNRQQRAMLAAQQRAQFLGQEFDQAFQARVQNSARIGDIANMNFTAEQQVALENARAANTVNLQNLSNRQAKVMAEAAALSQLDMANLNNRQQQAVQNAQNFLQMDLTNLSNEQQTGLFKAQQNIQALFTDQAAQNAAAQFNASSENQTNQFFESLASQTAQFNASQQNAMEQFNVNSVNALRQFNSEMQQQRDMFNAQNGLVVAQANAQWRQNIATLNTAAQNEANMNFAQTVNALTATNLDNIWQRERDIMSYAFTQSESALDRALNILLADKELEAFREKMANDEESARFAVATKLLFST